MAYTDAWRAHQVRQGGVYETVKRDVPCSFDFDRERILRENFIPVLCFLHRRSCWEAVGGFDESLPVLEDWDLWIRLSRRFRFRHVARVTCEFRWRTDGSTMTVSQGDKFPQTRQVIAQKIIHLLEAEVNAAESQQRCGDALGSAGVPAGAETTCRSMELSRNAPAGMPALPGAVSTSIIVLAFNQLEHTRKCLESLRAHCPADAEFSVVDNGSNDGTADYLRELAAREPRLRSIRNRDNRGFAAGNDQGLALARGRYLVLLNNDTVVTQGWLDRMTAWFEQEATLGLIGPVSNCVSGPQWVGAANYSKLEEMPAFAARWAAGHEGQSEAVRRLVGFCLMFRREVLERIGGLDERFGSGNYEDDDYCLRAALAGYPARIAKDIFIHHAGSQTFKHARIDYRQAMLTNWALFKAKWDLPADAPLEKGYAAPAVLPPGLSLKVPLPPLHLTHALFPEGRCWVDKVALMLTHAQSAQSSSQPQAAALPRCALVGSLDQARGWFGRKQLQEGLDGNAGRAPPSSVPPRGPGCCWLRSRTAPGISLRRGSAPNGRDTWPRPGNRPANSSAAAPKGAATPIGSFCPNRSPPLTQHATRNTQHVSPCALSSRTRRSFSANAWPP